MLRDRPHALLALCALTAIASACERASDQAVYRDDPVLRPTPCAAQEDDARCFYLDVPEARPVTGERAVAGERSVTGEPSARRIALYVSVLPARAGDGDREPLLTLGGGPGSEPPGSDWATHPLHERRDIVRLWQRGVAYSEPSLECGEQATAERTDPARSSDDPLALEDARRAAQACRDRLSDRGIDLAQYTTPNSAADIEALRIALGAERFHLYGVSYGTRLALEVMRAYPSSVASAVLISTLPAQVDFFGEYAENIDRAVQDVFDACERDPDCPSRDLRGELDAWVTRMDETPLIIAGEDGTPIRYYDGGSIGALLANAFYERDDIAQIPAWVHAADMFDVPAPQATAQLNELSSFGLYASIMCSEQIPFTDRERTLRAPSYLRGNRWDRRELVAECEVWNVPPAPQALRAPVSSDAPVLMIAGRYDAITPLSWTQLAAETLPNAQIVELPGDGHGSQTGTLCVQRMVAAFIEAPQASVDTTCVDDELGPIDF